MSKKVVCATVIGAVLAGAGAGVGVAADKAVDPATLVAAKLGITAYEPDNQVGGGGAPQKVLVDNDVTRVSLVSFKKGFMRPGKMKRRYDQLLVYIDKSDFTLTWGGVRGAAIEAKDQKPSTIEPGGVTFHPRETVVSESRINNDYRVVFVEMKK